MTGWRAEPATRISCSRPGQNLIVLCITEKVNPTEIAPFSWELKKTPAVSKEMALFVWNRIQGHSYVGLGFMGCFKDEESFFFSYDHLCSFIMLKKGDELPSQLNLQHILFWVNTKFSMDWSLCCQQPDRISRVSRLV